MHQDNANNNGSHLNNDSSLHNQKRKNIQQSIMLMGANATKIANLMAPAVKLSNNAAKLSPATLKAFNSASQIIADSVRAPESPSLKLLTEELAENAQRAEERKRQAQAEAIAKANAEAFQSVFTDVLEKSNQNAEDLFKRTKIFQVLVAVFSVIFTIIGSAAVSYWFTNTSASPTEMSQQQVTSVPQQPIVPLDHESGPSITKNSQEQIPNSKNEEDISANVPNLPTDQNQTSNTPKSK